MVEKGAASFNLLKIISTTKTKRELGFLIQISENEVTRSKKRNYSSLCVVLMLLMQLELVLKPQMIIKSGSHTENIYDAEGNVIGVETTHNCK